MSAPGWSKVTQDEAAEMYAEVRAEVLREAADTQWAYARDHWRPADGDSHSAVAKKERKFGAAERLICLIDPNPPILLPRAVRVLPHEDGFVVRWQVGEEARSTWRATRSGADAAADGLRRMADGGKDIRKDESTQPGGPFERVTVVLTAASSAALNHASEATGDTKTDTINRALQTYARLSGVVADGGKVLVQQAEGQAGEDIPAGDESAPPAPDFFQPGRTYTRPSHGRTAEFRVTHIGTDPDGHNRTAFGWTRIGGYDTWRDHSTNDLGSWTEITEAGESRA